MNINAHHPAPSIVAQRPGVAYYHFPPHLSRRYQYFNPSLADWQGARWLVVRRRRIDRHPGHNDITLWRIAADGLPLTVERSLRLFSLHPGEHFEDPRAVVDDGRLYVSCASFQLPFTASPYVHQRFAEVNALGQAMRIARPVYGDNGASNATQRGHEKNWCWFRDHQNVEAAPDAPALPDAPWRFVYSPAPHTVVTPHKDGYTEHRSGSVAWSYGLARGGTPPVYVPADNLYWSFFHSSIDLAPTPPRRRYYLGAYAFLATPPFTPVLATPTPLLVGSEADPRELSAPLCVFPCGALLDYPPFVATPTWTVSLGVNDLHCARLVVAHAELRALCEPIAPAPTP